MGNLKELLRRDPTALDRLIQLMAFVKADEKLLEHRWTETDWKCMEAVTRVTGVPNGSNT